MKWAQLYGILNILWHCLSLELNGSETFTVCGHSWIFQICWYIECSTLMASSFRIWSSSAGIPSPPLALFVVMLPKAFREPLWRVPPMTRSWRKYQAGKAIQDPIHDEVMRTKTWQARPSRIRDPPGWPWSQPHPVSAPLFCCCSCLPCCRFLCCLPRALLLLFHWMRTNLKP